MPLYLKVVLPIAGLILGIFSLTVPEGARSQSPTNEAAPRTTAPVYLDNQMHDLHVERPDRP
jgi:hypothetical protein